MKKCHKCAAALREDYKPGFKDLCKNCGQPLHCCLNCSLYNEGRHNKCKSPTTEWVGDRQKNNFCEEFLLTEQFEKKPDKPSGDKWRGLWKE